MGLIFYNFSLANYIFSPDLSLKLWFHYFQLPFIHVYNHRSSSQIKFSMFIKPLLSIGFLPNFPTFVNGTTILI